MLSLYAFFFANFGLVFVGVNLTDSLFDLFPYPLLVNQKPFMSVQVRVEFFYPQWGVSQVACRRYCTRSRGLISIGRGTALRFSCENILPDCACSRPGQERAGS